VKPAILEDANGEALPAQDAREIMARVL